jgi:hypothetical protein
MHDVTTDHYLPQTTAWFVGPKAERNAQLQQEQTVLQGRHAPAVFLFS